MLGEVLVILKNNVARAHGEYCRITVFIHGQACASETERELLLAATVSGGYRAVAYTSPNITTPTSARQKPARLNVNLELCACTGRVRKGEEPF